MNRKPQGVNSQPTETPKTFAAGWYNRFLEDRFQTEWLSTAEKAVLALEESEKGRDSLAKQKSREAIDSVLTSFDKKFNDVVVGLANHYSKRGVLFSPTLEEHIVEVQETAEFFRREAKNALGKAVPIEAKAKVILDVLSYFSGRTN